jgi:hypothetical protein
MEIKYAVRTISPSPHKGPCYLQESEYGLQFTLRAAEPREIHYFGSKEEALKYMEEHFKYKYFEVVETYIV